MFTRETRIEGFDARAWHRLVTLVAPGLASRAPHEHDARAAEEGGTLLVLYHETRVLRALHSHRGVVRESQWPGREGLASLAEKHGARFVLAAEVGALEEWYERIGGRLTRDDGASTTVLVCTGALRELYDEGELHFWPSILPSGVPLPTAAVLARSFDFLLPEGRCALLALFADDALETAVLVRRNGGSIDRVYGPEALRSMMGPIGGDFRRDHKIMRAAIERAVGPLAFALSAETSTVHRLLRAETPGAWAAALATRDLIADPMPAWLAVTAGAGAARAAAGGVRTALGSSGLNVLDRFGLGDALGRAREKLTDALGAAGFDLEKTLGFDPLSIVGNILRRSGEGGSPARDDGED